MSRFFFDWTPRRQEIVHRGLQAGENHGDIAARLGCSRSALRRFLKSQKETGNGA